MTLRVSPGKSVTQLSDHVTPLRSGTARRASSLSLAALLPLLVVLLVLVDRELPIDVELLAEVDVSTGVLLPSLVAAVRLSVVSHSSTKGAGPLPSLRTVMFHSFSPFAVSSSGSTVGCATRP